jgi:opacity protein-like surface antigen
MSKVLISLLMVLSLASSLSAAAQVDEVLYLKNGSIIRGTIIEQIPNVSVKIRTLDGSIFVYKVEEIEKITKESPKPESQDAGKKPSRRETDFGLRLGYFIPFDESVKEIYGNGPVFGAEVITWQASGLGVGVVAEYYGKSGKPITTGSVFAQSAKARLVPFYLAFMYRATLTNSSIRPYFGAGWGRYFFNEKITFIDQGVPYRASVSKNPLGLHAFAGLQAPFSSSASFVLEVKFSYASISQTLFVGTTNAGEVNSKNIGGVSAIAGVRF